MNRSQLFIIAAMADNRVIGAAGTIPWHISEDFRRLKALTMGKPLVMGRKTFESLPGLLPGRRHIVVTRNPDWSADGAEPASSLSAALKLANAPHIVIFGGAALFAEALPLADRIELTEVHLTPPGDVLFPVFDRSQWTETFREHHLAQGKTPGFDFVTLLRKPEP